MIDTSVGLAVLLIFSFLVSCLLEMMVLPRVIYIAKKKGLYDIPDGRKSHTLLVPRLAGVSFFPILLFVFSICALIYALLSPVGSLMYYEPAIIKFFGMLAGNMVLLAVGIKDDLVGSRYMHKMLGQIIAAILLVSGGLYINDFNGLFGIYDIPAYIGVPFTILLVVFITNAINFIDGVDGLASGISAVALVAFAIFFFLRGMFIYTLISTIILGILAPFYYYNVFGTRRKIFMGDTGSLTLGFLLAYLGIRFSMNSYINYNLFPAPVMLALSALFIPIFDALRVMLERALSGKSMFLPDRRHIHHKLLDIGFTHRKVMLSLVACVAFIIILNFTLLLNFNINIVFSLDIVLWLGFIKVLNLLKRRRTVAQMINNQTVASINA